jgi:hypothetical protein
MRLATPFDPIEVGEIDNFGFDFTLDMGAATIVSTGWSCVLAPFQPAGVTDPMPQARILSATPQTSVMVRAVDGTLQTRTGFFSIASVGGFPASGMGGTYILEGTANLSDGRVLKLNSTVLCKLPGP